MRAYGCGCVCGCGCFLGRELSWKIGCFGLVVRCCGVGHSVGLVKKD